MAVWLEVFGWVGSILVVWSLTQARVLRFRWMNLAGAVVATAYNAVVGVWPFAAMNAAIAVIDVYWLVRLYREAHDAAVYQVVEVDPDDAYLRHVLRVHAEDVARSYPSFHPDDGPQGRAAFLVVRGDETVGVVVLHEGDDGEARVELDWVTPRFRDFTPGEFVHRSQDLFAAHGFRRVVVVGATERQHEYLGRVGFRPEGDRWVREVGALPR
ncbi:inner membrane protein [Isoptericola jiangsuensis]|uniref:Inner membrane protein n=1 Tax=Isoptericola jiangsuensis TaxID=548579 RepID=A0A2A9F027_9MICO|nr:YgjV family protein [Isoptericola jiangsuensis]PFG44664.1 inner membrane protein [Isoptericola jiangsuensis]